MDTNFVDLDMLLTRIREPRSRVYFLDAVKAYRAGALRASLSSTWVAVVYDLIAKYRELSASGDAAASAFLTSWDTATKNNDVQSLLKLESSIVDDATRTTQILNHIAERHLSRLREDRNLCAHPAYSTEAELFEPSPELVRLHLVSAIDFVLSQEPLQGKALLNEYDTDVQSSGFPSTHAKVLNYVEERYLRRIRHQNVLNFAVVLAKSLLLATPAQWEPHHKKVASSLVAIHERRAESWASIQASVVRLINSLDAAHRLRVISFVARFQEFWPSLDSPVKTALLETVANMQAADLRDYRIFSAMRIPIFRPALERILAGLTTDQLGEALATEPYQELWPRALTAFRNSGSFRGAEANFRELISPYSGQLTSEQTGEVLDAIMDNGQIWDAAETPSLLLALFTDAKRSDLPKYSARDSFLKSLKHYHRVDKYDDVLKLLMNGGWVPKADTAQENVES